MSVATDMEIVFHFLFYVRGVFFLFIKFTGVTLVNKIIQVQGTIPQHTICTLQCVFTTPSHVSVRHPVSAMPSSAPHSLYFIFKTTFSSISVMLDIFSTSFTQLFTLFNYLVMVSQKAFSLLRFVECHLLKLNVLCNRQKRISVYLV